MDNQIILPMELINKILIMRQPTELNESLNFLMNCYKDYINDDYEITFSDYMLKLKHLYEDYNIKKIKKHNNNNLLCDGCNNNIFKNQYYFSNNYVINCNECF